MWLVKVFCSFPYHMDVFISDSWNWSVITWNFISANALSLLWVTGAVFCMPPWAAVPQLGMHDVGFSLLRLCYSLVYNYKVLGFFSCISLGNFCSVKIQNRSLWGSFLLYFWHLTIISKIKFQLIYKDHHFGTKQYDCVNLGEKSKNTHVNTPPRGYVLGYVCVCSQ